MKSCYRLKKNFQYNYVYKHATKVADSNVVVLYCKSNKQQSQIGFSVGKKYGHAVVRNRIRRQMKAAAAKVMPSVKHYVNIVLIPRKTCYDDFSALVESVTKLFRQADLLQTE